MLASAQAPAARRRRQPCSGNMQVSHPARRRRGRSRRRQSPQRSTCSQRCPQAGMPAAERGGRRQAQARCEQRRTPSSSCPVAAGRLRAGECGQQCTAAATLEQSGLVGPDQALASWLAMDSPAWILAEPAPPARADTTETTQGRLANDSQASDAPGAGVSNDSPAANQAPCVSPRGQRK